MFENSQEKTKWLQAISEHVAICLRAGKKCAHEIFVFKLQQNMYFEFNY